MGGAYESIQQPSLVVEEKHYIAGVIVVSTYSSSQIASTLNLLKDNLGSLDIWIETIDGRVVTQKVIGQAP